MRRAPMDGDMTGTTGPETLEDDLAFLRAIAEQGRATAVFSGAYLVLWGVLVSGAYFNNWLVASGLWQGGGAAIGTGYTVMGVAGWIGSTILGFRERRTTGVRAVGDRIYTAVFVAAGLALTIFSIGATFSPAVPLHITMIVAALLMGLCFVITGILSRMVWMTAIGAVWFLAAAGLFPIAGTPAMLLTGALLWCGLLTGPGLVLMVLNARRAGPSATGKTGVVALFKGMRLSRS